MLETPNFKYEEEEANWWDDNPEFILEAFKQAAKNGTLSRSTLASEGLTRVATPEPAPYIAEQKPNSAA